MIINCEKWGSVSGVLAIESAFQLTKSKRSDRRDDNAITYHP
jgi:hypothetical protein